MGDLAACSAAWDHHLKLFDRMFNVLQKAGLTLKTIFIMCDFPGSGENRIRNSLRRVCYIHHPCDAVFGGVLVQSPLATPLGL